MVITKVIDSSLLTQFLNLWKFLVSYLSWKPQLTFQTVKLPWQFFQQSLSRCPLEKKVFFNCSILTSDQPRRKRGWKVFVSSPSKIKLQVHWTSISLYCTWSFIPQIMPKYSYKISIFHQTIGNTSHFCTQQEDGYFAMGQAPATPGPDLTQPNLTWPALPTLLMPNTQHTSNSNTSRGLMPFFVLRGP